MAEKKYSLSLSEQETITSFCAADSNLHVYTSYPPDVRYYSKLALEQPSICAVTHRDEYSIDIDLALSEFNRIVKQKKKRVLSDEQREALSQRAKKNFCLKG